MAELTVMGEYHGPGERKTVETLARDLPDSWTVIAGRKLPGRDRADLDIVVVGEALVFVIEEKSWGAAVHADPLVWTTSHSPRPSPIDRIAHLSRVLASLLADRVPGYKQAVGRNHVVWPVVILSHDELVLTLGEDFDRREIILQLAGGAAVNELKDRDAVEPAFPKQIRKAIRDFLVGFTSRPPGEMMIRDYVVDMVLEPLGRAERYLATNRTTGTQVVLSCYPLHGWGPGVDPAKLFAHEADALAQLEELGRTWRADESFVDDVNQLFVTPIKRDFAARTLLMSMKKEDPARIGGRVDLTIARQVVADAFQGLAEIHEAGLIHRAINPVRVFLSPRMKVRFSDFLLARIESGQTIGPWLDELTSPMTRTYMAPECGGDPRVASRPSDVYSLGLSLAVWLIGGDPSEPSVGELRLGLNELGSLGTAVTACLVEVPESRPDAALVALQLRSGDIIEETAPTAHEASGPTLDGVGSSGVQWVQGVTIDGRFLLERQLGEGGFAFSWLAKDLILNSARVLKQFKNSANWEAAAKEFEAASKLNHDRCARVWDLSKPDAHIPYIVCEYREGSDLQAFMASDQVIEVETCRQIALDVLEALAYIHGRALTHSDVTPRNVIVDADGRAALIDFGLMGIDAEGRWAGTPDFMSPEMTRGGRPSPRSDLFGLGLSMLTVMLGRRLFNQVGDAARPIDPEGPTELELRQWGPLGASIMKCFMKAISPNPDDRPSSAEEMSSALRSAIAVEEPRGLERQVNPTVDSVRLLYRRSSLGNAGNRGLDDTFAQDTYVKTRLDEKMIGAISAGEFRLVVLTGNPGDGKTSFLTRVRDHIATAGEGAVISDDASGWRLRVGDRVFAAVYDASESHGALSSDELLHQALVPGSADDGGGLVTLLAVNDGRVLQFFTDYEDRYPEFNVQVRRQLRGGAKPADGVAVIDLKKRSLVAHQPSESLGLKVLDALIANERWEACETCVSKHVCPIVKNVGALRSDAREGLHELLSTSHFRRLRRSTFRDLRSALSWLLTGDRGCDEIHAERERGIDPSLSSQSLLSDLAFSPQAADFLVREWADLDPANMPSPRLEREVSIATGMRGGDISQGALRSLHRRVFFGMEKGTAGHGGSVRAYRHFDEFTAALRAADGAVLDRVLLGLSRLLGAPGFSGEGLAISSSDPTAEWSVMKIVDRLSFSIDVEEADGTFVETHPDRLALRHESAGRIELSLDTFEVILRAAEGEVFNDQAADALILEIEGFIAQLQSQPAEVVHIVDPFGAAVSARRNGGSIELEML